MKTASKLSMTLLPESPGLRLENVAIDAKTVSLSVASTRPSAACPVCENSSDRLHSHYLRTVTDLPWGGRCVRLCLRVRRFRCSDPRCPRRIFAERLPQVVEPYARKTTRLEEILLLVGFALGGEAGTRLAGRLGMKASPSTLLRRLHGAQTRSSPLPEVIGVDDFALLKGRRYGTIIVDLEKAPAHRFTGRPLGRNPGSLAQAVPKASHHKPRPLDGIREGDRTRGAPGGGGTGPLAPLEKPAPEYGAHPGGQQ